MNLKRTKANLVGYQTLESLQTQLRVLYALLARELLTRYGRHNIGFVWLFAEPMLFTLGCGPWPKRLLCLACR
jgi:hypothetical protein